MFWEMCLTRLIVLILGSFLISEGVSESLHPYRELVRDDDLLAWGDFLSAVNVFWKYK